MKNRFPAATARKNDYIAYLAVMLFVFVVVSELFLVTWLPRKLHSEIMWQDHIAKEEMVELEDLLRAYMIGVKPKFRDMTGEIELVQAGLNEFASYLRDYKDSISRSQTDDIHSYLKGFERIYNSNIRPGITFIVAEKLDARPCIRKLLAEATAGNKADGKTATGN